MTQNERLSSLAHLGEQLQAQDDYLQAVMHRTHFNNPWFTIENQQRAVNAIAEGFLRKDKLEAWAKKYQDGAGLRPVPKNIGLVMAGNLPLVGFHDLLCVFVAGHRAKIKLSDKDQFLLPYLLKLLEKNDPASAAYFEIVEILKDFDAVIATGSNNSARYFEAYFGKKPHVIRRNRNAVAVLDGSETTAELLALGNDVFQYFGLGCRNVSKIYVPTGYNFQPLLEALHEYNDVILHQKYKNNYDYNLSILILNRILHFNNGCILLAENQAIASRIAMLNYEFYEDAVRLKSQLEGRQDEIQCLVAKHFDWSGSTVGFGKTQEPALEDYADGVDTMAFLVKI